jgi:hypothetical protein
MNNRGTIAGVAFFIGIIIAIIIIAPIILMVSLKVMDTTATQLGTMTNTNASVNLINYTRNTVATSFDWAIMLIIIVDFVVLLVSSFLIDVHPVFVVFYILGAFVLVITAPYSMIAAEKIYSMIIFNDPSTGVIQYIPMTEFMLNNFGVLIVGILVLTGIIIYAKIRFSSNSTGGNY